MEGGKEGGLEEFRKIRAYNRVRQRKRIKTLTEEQLAAKRDLDKNLKHGKPSPKGCKKYKKTNQRKNQMVQRK